MASRMILSAVLLVLCAVCIQTSSGSAIPMWEYLSRGEKMSHLYTMFAKQVNSYCKTNTADHSMKPQCKRELLLHGLGNLNKMSETHLDAMDPYQRGATDLVWDHMMDGHPMMAGKKEVTTQAPIRQDTNYPKNPLFDDDTPKVMAPKKPSKTHEDYAMGMDSDPMYEQYQLPKEQENLYPEPQNHLHQETKVSEQYVDPAGESSGFLGGPMMIMVRPDGTMVRAIMPKDDDKEAMTLGRDRLPTIEQLSKSYQLRTTRNFLDENHDISSTVEPRQFRTVRFTPEKRQFYYHHPSYLPQGYKTNQH